MLQGGKRGGSGKEGEKTEDENKEKEKEGRLRYKMRGGRKESRLGLFRGDSGEGRIQEYSLLTLQREKTIRVDGKRRKRGGGEIRDPPAAL